ncbi:uncharacterized protein LOC122047608 [Zingiber officinale]|uniref:Plant/F9H3-4 protein n=1 Tax=Zingiber officinale TaxID=94328 RepID=A0A8J5LLI0_ZINOF|nr:uncharacterized protein LOC122043104 [Zingiber officinale]XP_042464928.1 uncharacterized protein LOC122047608 [Zingiber officinale]KAG6526409.1 hypothetical protein ZIOFF_016393 [Zingiber officinale]KAG6530221.1 hypothetical protein ZIOFF_012444 [Zingiber officinale]
MEANWRKRSNLQAFLSGTTPRVPISPFPKTNSYWQPVLQGKVENFNLEDLWDQYREWSAYGLGVPIVLDNGASVVEYYVPYLSAIQIYTSKSHALTRCMLEDSEKESFSDDSESEKLSRLSDVSDDFLVDQDASWSSRHLLGQLYLQYIEYGSPYARIPLFDKVNELAQNYPGLTLFKSVDISPASWMSVAWYPIYHIPSCRNVKDLSTCFLTYHTISTLFQENNDVLEEVTEDSCSANTGDMMEKTRGSISLRPFGLATYKLEGDLWINPETSDNEVMSTLYSAAYSWLKQLVVEHHDFDFFTTH